MLYVVLFAKLLGVLVTVLGLIDLTEKSHEHMTKSFMVISEEERANGVVFEDYRKIKLY